MKDFKLHIGLLLLFLILALVYYAGIADVDEIDKTFLTLSTFLFALFTGFFISRQATRYSEIRKLTANFDGVLSSVYRSFMHYGDEAWHKAGEIIKNHYNSVTESGWDYHLKNKSTTLTNLHILTDETVNAVGSDGVKGAITTRIILGLHDAQKIRKNMVALHDERIPGFQLMLIYILTAMLVLIVSSIPSGGLMLGSFIKAAFILSVVVVVILLKRLDNLELFSGGIGEKSAQDVLNIIEGTR